MVKEEESPDRKNWKFAEELAAFEKVVYPPRTLPYGKKELSFEMQFPDPEGLLESAFQSFRRYWEGAGHSLASAPGENTLSFRIRKGEGEKESFLLEIKEDAITLSSPDTEGIRRGIYHFIDLLCGEGGAFPPPQTLQKKPFLAVRLGRCPFSPIKRWPINTDELLEDVDYYPDAYLERLAREGVNGIWIVTALRELGVSSFIPPDPQREKRLEKLAKVAEKCRKYGVKIYLFMIEPYAVFPEDDLLKSHPEFFGPSTWGGRICYCSAHPGVRQHLRELFASTFSAVPALGGVVNITYGERPTSCLSSLPQKKEGKIECLEKCGASHNLEPLALSLKAMWEGMHSAAPEAEFFAWFYMPDPEKLPSHLEDISSYVPDEIITQFNFESGGEKTQLGRPHIGNDYWVSYIGPSARFVHAAKKRKGKKLSAKLQLGAGYELTTVPGIPAPSIAFQKYKAMKELGVGYVMQSWYVGNFPSIMSRAMGLLAFEEFREPEEAFLEKLARIDWGESAPQIVKAWQHFGTSYDNYPFSIMFQYYAPQNSFPMWKFHFLPELLPLAPPWKPIFPFGGDMIGESLAGFSIEEVITLLEKMCEEWKKGMAFLAGLREKFARNRARLRDLGICEFLEITLKGTLHIFQFYFLRRELFTAGKKETLSAMKEIIGKQIDLYKRAIPLLEEDSRLGFHGEALVRLFDEEKTRQAIVDGEKALAEAAELEKEEDLLSLAFRKKILEERDADTLHKAVGDNGDHLFWSYTLPGNGKIRFTFFQEEGKEKDHMLLLYFADLCGVSFPLQERFLVQGGSASLIDNTRYLVTGFPFESKVQCAREGRKFTIEYPVSLLPGEGKEEYLRFMFLVAAPEGKLFWSKGKGHPVAPRLLLGNTNFNDSFTLKIK